MSSVAQIPSPRSRGEGQGEGHGDGTRSELTLPLIRPPLHSGDFSPLHIGLARYEHRDLRKSGKPDLRAGRRIDQRRANSLSPSLRGEGRGGGHGDGTRSELTLPLIRPPLHSGDFSPFTGRRNEERCTNSLSPLRGRRDDHCLNVEQTMQTGSWAACRGCPSTC